MDESMEKKCLLSRKTHPHSRITCPYMRMFCRQNDPPRVQKVHLQRHTYGPEPVSCNCLTARSPVLRVIRLVSQASGPRSLAG